LLVQKEHRKDERECNLNASIKLQYKEKRPPIVMLLICYLHKNEKTLTHPEGFRDSNRMFFLFQNKFAKATKWDYNFPKKLK